MASTSDLSKGMFIRYNNELVIIVEFEHRTPGNLRAFYQVKMRNIKSGKLFEHRFRTGEDVEIVRVETRELQYLYKDGSLMMCMDTETFDQIAIDEAIFGQAAVFLKEEMNVKVSFDDETPVFAEPPIMVELEISYAEPGLRGDSTSRSLKPATLETGAQISVPLFVNQGDRIRVDTRTGEYIERVK